MSKSMRKYFASDISYNNWLYAKSLAEKVNAHIKNGDIVYDVNGNDMSVILPFTFFFMGGPVIGELSEGGNACYSWFGCMYNREGLKIMEGRRQIRKKFSSLLIVKRSDIKKLQID